MLLFPERIKVPLPTLLSPLVDVSGTSMFAKLLFTVIDGVPEDASANDPMPLAVTVQPCAPVVSPNVMLPIERT